MSGFMDSHKHWMIIDEEEPVVNVEEPAALSTGNDDQEGGWQHDEGDHDDGEDAEHVVDDIIQVDNNIHAADAANLSRAGPSCSRIADEKDD